MVVSVGDGGWGGGQPPPSCEAYPDTQTTEFAPMDTEESSISLNSKSGLSEESATGTKKSTKAGKGKGTCKLHFTEHSNKYAYYF